MPKTSFDELARVLLAHRDELLALPHVTGVDIGLSYVEGKMTNNLAIRLYVRSIADVDIASLPGEVDEAPVFILEVGDIVSSVASDACETDVNKPLPGKPSCLVGGVSTGSCRALTSDGSGTLGIVLHDRNGLPTTISNFHVFAYDKNWALGDGLTSPSLQDGGSCPSTSLGFLQQGCLADVVPCSNVTVDCARGSAQTAFTSWIRCIGAIKGIAENPVPPFNIRKVGRTSGLTTGVVDGVMGTISVNVTNFGVVTFHNQLTAAIVTEPGDSGACFVDDHNNLVALNFAKSDNAYRAYANPFSDVQKTLEVTVPGVIAYGQFNVGNNTISGRPWVTEDTGWVYFRGTDGTLWKVRIDGTQQINFNTTTNSTPFAGAGDGWVYFNGPNLELMKIRTDGSGLVGLGYKANSMPWVKGDWIYFQNTDNKLCRLSISTQVFVDMDDTCASSPFVAQDGYIYYQRADDKLYRMTIIGANRTWLNNYTASMPWAPGDGWVYFRGNDDRLLKVTTDGKSTLYLNNSTYDTPFVTNDGWIYFEGTGLSHTLWKCDVNGNQRSAVNGNSTLGTPFVTSGAVFFQGTDIVAQQLWCCPR